MKNVRYYENLHQAQPECHPATTIGLKEQVGNTLDVLIYPNPASRRVIIRLPDNNKQAGIRLIDVSGRLVKQTAADANADVTLNISDLAPGVYFVEVNSGNLRSSQKLIKD